MSAVARDGWTQTLVKRGYHIRFAREGYRIIDAEGREVRRIVVLRMRDWLRGWRMASKRVRGLLS